MSELKNTLQDAMKDAMRAKDKERLTVIRLLTAAIKQYEVDNRAEIDDTLVLAILDKQAKQRRESIKQFETAQRDDLVQQEVYELAIIQEFLPQQYSDAEINDLITEAIATTNAADIKDMGKVMGVLKPKMQGRADMSKVSAAIKQQLNS